MRDHFRGGEWLRQHAEAGCRAGSGRGADPLRELDRAVAGAIGNVTTLDSFSDGLHLSRTASPHYSADVPPMGPWGTKLSMQFANEGLGGPAFPGLYGRTTA